MLMAQSKNDLKNSYSLTSWRQAPGPRRLIGTASLLEEGQTNPI